MDKSTLSNYGWVVIAVLVLSVMIALATPFGEYIGNAVKSTTEGLFDTSEKALNVVGLSAGGDNGAEETPAYDHNAPELHPDDGSTPIDGNTYEFGNYKYTYYSSLNGWKVSINTAVTDKKQTSYGPILESINGEPVTSMSYTFNGCNKLTIAPEIPNSVTDMGYTFSVCTALTTAPAIPSSVTNMEYTFNQTSLTTAPKIPNSVTNMDHTFFNCTSLTTAPEIPNSVTNMSYTFRGCTSLTKAPEIPSSVTDMYFTFNGCTSLTGSITINSTPTRYNHCLYSTQITEILGSCTVKDEILATK